MAIMGADRLTLADWAERIDPGGAVSRIAEILARTNQILEDAVWVEGNLPTGHRTTVRTDLPEVTWRLLNYGVKPSKSETKQIDDACGMLEAYAEIDKALADLNGNTADFRLSEDRAFLEAMNQEFASTFIYGDTRKNPERFLGLAPRFDSAGDENVIDFGGSGEDCTSIWVVCWSENTVHLTFPKGSKAGISHSDLGEVTLEDNQNPPGKYQGYRTHYLWRPGLVVRDWRYVVRLGSINVSDLGGSTLRDGLIEAVNMIPNPDMGRTVIYCNRAVKTLLDREAAEKQNVMLNLAEWSGRPVTTFWGCPVRRVDSILNNEAAL